MNTNVYKPSPNFEEVGSGIYKLFNLRLNYDICYEHFY